MTSRAELKYRQMAEGARASSPPGPKSRKPSKPGNAPRPALRVVDAGELDIKLPPYKTRLEPIGEFTAPNGWTVRAYALVAWREG